MINGHYTTAYGRKGTAPCGHDGEHIVGNYVHCSLGCDTPNKVVDGKKCPECSGPVMRQSPYRKGKPHPQGGEEFCTKCRLWLLKDGRRLKY